MKPRSAAAFALGLAVTAAGAGAQAGTQAANVYNLALTGAVAGFTEGTIESDGYHFDQFSVWLNSTDFPVTVAQGDTVNTTVTFDGLVTIPLSQIRTDLVQYLGGDNFPSVNAQVDGAYTFYNGETFVATYGFTSTTSGGLATFAALFPPANGAFSFDSFTDNFVVTSMSTPGEFTRSSFTYSLVSDAVPEPAGWALMILGFGAAGAMLRRRGVLVAA